MNEDEMETLAHKVRLATLWLLSAVAFFAYRTLALSAGATEVSVLGDDFAAYLAVMMVFAFLALTLPTRLNRLVNLVAGGIVGVAQIIMLIDGLVGYPSATFNLMTGVTVASMASVVWLARRWRESATKDAAHRTSDQTPPGILRRLSP